MFFQITRFDCESKTVYLKQDSPVNLGKVYHRMYYGISLIFLQLLPVIIICIFTVLLSIFIQRRKQARPQSNNQETQERKMNDLTVCLIVVALCFLIFIVPDAIVSAMFVAGVSNCLFFKALYILTILPPINSSVNFVIYYWKLASFREAVKKVIKKEGITQLGTKNAVVCSIWTLSLNNLFQKTELKLEPLIQKRGEPVRTLFFQTFVINSFHQINW